MTHTKDYENLIEGFAAAGQIITNGNVYNQKKIFQAMIDIAKDIDAIGKNRQNVKQNFKFRGIDDVYNCLHTLMADKGVFSLPTILSESREERTTNNGGTLLYTKATIKYTFYASDGSSVECSVIGEGMDSGDKASNKAMAIAHKYALLQAFTIPTEDMVDPDKESHTVLPKPVTKPVSTSVKIPTPKVGSNEPKKDKPLEWTMATDKQRALIWALLTNDLKFNEELSREFILHHTGKESGKDLTKDDIQILVDAINNEMEIRSVGVPKEDEWTPESI